MQTRKALIIGIDYYEFNHIPCLNGCGKDAKHVAEMLSRNPADNSVNFGIELMIADCHSHTIIKREDLISKLQTLFNNETGIEVALFYFAGHGYIDMMGGYLCTSDCKNGNDGINLNDVITLANKSKATNKVIILDSCHGGIAGENTLNKNVSEIGEGVTILTASTAEQYAEESNGKGLFTELLVDALQGSAANLMGEITPGSIYAHIDQSLGAWAQRPVFKTNVKNFVSLRNVRPNLPLTDLQRIIEFFPNGKDEYQLDPTYEPDDTVKLRPEDKSVPKHTEIFAVLQEYNRVGLVVPIEAKHMYYAAMDSKKAGLTLLGKHYRDLREKNLF